MGKKANENSKYNPASSVSSRFGDQRRNRTFLVVTILDKDLQCHISFCCVLHYFVSLPVGCDFIFASLA